jgi:hypothetical protein
MNKSTLLVLSSLLSAGLLSCNKDESIIVPTLPPSDGKTQVLNGGAGGANAMNTVYVDFSADRQDSVARSSWDLGFYNGPEFRVVLNNTTSAGAKVLTKNNLNEVGASDTIGLTLATSQSNPQPSDLAYFDDLSGNINGTVIPAISANEADNKVIILNRGTGGATPARPWVKLRVLRNGSNGYTIQWAGITETSFRTTNIVKGNEHHFGFLSLDNGNTVNVEPKKAEWDIVWSYSVFKTNFGGGDVPYNFSDLVAINTLGGAEAAQIMTDTVAYADFNETHLTSTSFTADRWTIGNNWRTSAPPPAISGVRTDRFYIIKDPAGNIYKLRFISFSAADGGVRGYPLIEYKLVKKG